MRNDFTAYTPEELREMADKARQRGQESRERSDTDGFLSQWGSDRMAMAYDLAAKTAEDGWTAEFTGLYHRETDKRVKAKIVRVENTYSYQVESKWVVLDDCNNAIHWLPAYKKTKSAKLWKLGFEERPETAKCTVEMIGNDARAVAKRTDGGFPESAVPVNML